MGKEKKSKKDDRHKSKKRKHRHEPDEHVGPLRTHFKADPDAVPAGSGTTIPYDPNIRVKHDPDAPPSPPAEPVPLNDSFDMANDDTIYTPSSPLIVYPHEDEEETINVKEEPEEPEQNEDYNLRSSSTNKHPANPTTDDEISDDDMDQEVEDHMYTPSSPTYRKRTPEPSTSNQRSERVLAGSPTIYTPSSPLARFGHSSEDEHEDVYVKQEPEIRQSKRRQPASPAVQPPPKRMPPPPPTIQPPKRMPPPPPTVQPPPPKRMQPPTIEDCDMANDKEEGQGNTFTTSQQTSSVDSELARQNDNESPKELPLTNVFHLSSRPLPLVERDSKAELDITLMEQPKARQPEQGQEAGRRQDGGRQEDDEGQEEGDGQEEEEPGHSDEPRTGHHQPIVYHHEDSDAEDEAPKDHNTTTPVIEKQQRYFKQRGLPQKYDFKYFKYPHIQKLAVYQHKDTILDAIIKNHIVVVEGFTGCGKTTQVPQFIMDHCVQNQQACDIVVTQPRRIATISVCRRVCEERGWNMGDVVGYQVGMDKHIGRDTLITYMTTGVLLQKLISDRSLKKFTHIVIDEVHERDLESDFLLLIIKKILMEDKTGQERHVKIILMSATLNAQKFSQYFSLVRRKYGEVEKAPIIKIPLELATHAIQEQFLEDQMDDREMKELEFTREKAVLHNSIYDVAVRTIVNLDVIDRTKETGRCDPRYARGQIYAHMKPDNRGSVLVFLPGFAEIDTMAKRLEAESNKHGKPNMEKWTIIPLHSTITTEEQQRAFAPTEKQSRKIILSTNIAESSITVPDIVYVIDFCLTKSQDLDSRTNFSCLRTVWASLSQCIQRKGRTGRVGQGYVFRLVPKSFYLKMEKDTVPEMLRAGLETVIVRVKSFDMGNPQHMLSLSIDAPQSAGIERAIVNLKELGGLTMEVTDKVTNERRYDIFDGDLTFLGKLMSQLPIPHQCVRLIMLGHAFCVLKECVIIAAGLSVKSPFSTSFHHKLASYHTKFAWSKKGYSDCLAILHLYNEWDSKFNSQRRGPSERSWAKMSNVHIAGLKEMKTLIDELNNRLKGANVRAFPFSFGTPSATPGELTKEQLSVIKIAIAGAFYPNYFHRQRPRQDYERERYREIHGGNLFNTVFFKGFTGDHCKTLYGGIIAEKYAFGAGIPKVTFDGQKVLVEFDGSTEKIGPISKSVYTAVKKRQLRERMSFKVLSKQDEYDYLAKQERLLRDRSAKYIKCPDQVELPPIFVKEFPLILTHMESPSQFWVVYTRNEQRLNEVSEIINTNMERRIPLRDEQIGPGALCLAPFTTTDDGGSITLFYRARIRSVDCALGRQRKALVYFVDYGNSEWLPTRDLYDFNEVHRRHGVLTELCMAVECRLADIKPAVLYGSVWHDSVIRNMKEFVKNPIPKKMEIFSVTRSVIAGTLYGVSPNALNPNGPPQLHNVNRRLVEDGFAEIVQENPECMQNNDVRKQAANIMRNGDTTRMKAHNEAQIEKMNDIIYMVPPPQDRARISVELKGPWSPLELTFESLCHSSNCKEVSIDDNSVNSVALDQEPSAPTSRLVVAASVQIQDKSGRVVARDTTMMPAIPGLMSLIPMIFAPKIELRVDRYQTYYTGALCGLGADPNNAAIYQDHDMEVMFDTAIVDDDIDRINRIRHHLNIILRETGNLATAQTHLNIVKEMFELMRGPRAAISEPVWPQDIYSWGKIPQERIIPPKEPVPPLSPLDIFPLHSKVQLENCCAPEISFNDWAI